MLGNKALKALLNLMNSSNENLPINYFEEILKNVNAIESGEYLDVLKNLCIQKSAKIPVTNPEISLVDKSSATLDENDIFYDPYEDQSQIKGEGEKKVENNQKDIENGEDNQKEGEFFDIDNNLSGINEKAISETILKEKYDPQTIGKINQVIKKMIPIIISNGESRILIDILKSSDLELSDKKDIFDIFMENSLDSISVLQKNKKAEITKNSNAFLSQEFRDSVVNFITKYSVDTFEGVSAGSNDVLRVYENMLALHKFNKDSNINQPHEFILSCASKGLLDDIKEIPPTLLTNFSKYNTAVSENEISGLILQDSRVFEKIIDFQKVLNTDLHKNVLNQSLGELVQSKKVDANEKIDIILKKKIDLLYEEKNIVDGISNLNNTILLISNTEREETKTFIPKIFKNLIANNTRKLELNEDQKKKISTNINKLLIKSRELSPALNELLSFYTHTLGTDFITTYVTRDYSNFADKGSTLDELRVRNLQLAYFFAENNIKQDNGLSLQWNLNGKFNEGLISKIRNNPLILADCDTKGNTLLHNLILHGHFAKVEKFVSDLYTKNGLNLLDFKNNEGVTPSIILSFIKDQKEIKNSICITNMNQENKDTIMYLHYLKGTYYEDISKWNKLAFLKKLYSKENSGDHYKTSHRLLEVLEKLIKSDEKNIDLIIKSAKKHYKGKKLYSYVVSLMIKYGYTDKAEELIKEAGNGNKLEFANKLEFVEDHNTDVISYAILTENIDDRKITQIENFIETFKISAIEKLDENKDISNLQKKQKMVEIASQLYLGSLQNASNTKENEYRLRIFKKLCTSLNIYPDGELLSKVLKSSPIESGITDFLSRNDKNFYNKMLLINDKTLNVKEARHPSPFVSFLKTTVNEVNEEKRRQYINSIKTMVKNLEVIESGKTSALANLVGLAIYELHNMNAKDGNPEKLKFTQEILDSMIEMKTFGLDTFEGISLLSAFMIEGDESNIQKITNKTKVEKIECETAIVKSLQEVMPVMQNMGETVRARCEAGIVKAIDNLKPIEVKISNDLLKMVWLHGSISLIEKVEEDIKFDELNRYEDTNMVILKSALLNNDITVFERALNKIDDNVDIRMLIKKNSDLLTNVISGSIKFNNGREKFEKLIEYFQYQEKEIINSPDSNGITPLMCAILHNDVKLIDFLISKEEININARDANGNTALMYACASGDRSIIDMILKSPLRNKIDINVQNNNGYSAYKLALHHFVKDDLTNEKVDVGIGVNKAEPSAIEPDAEIIRMLLEKGANHEVNKPIKFMDVVRNAGILTGLNFALKTAATLLPTPIKKLFNIGTTYAIADFISKQSGEWVKDSLFDLLKLKDTKINLEGMCLIGVPNIQSFNKPPYFGLDKAISLNNFKEIVIDNKNDKSPKEIKSTRNNIFQVLMSRFYANREELKKTSVFNFRKRSMINKSQVEISEALNLLVKSKGKEREMDMKSFASFLDLFKSERSVCDFMDQLSLIHKMNKSEKDLNMVENFVEKLRKIAEKVNDNKIPLPDEIRTNVLRAVEYYDNKVMTKISLFDSIKNPLKKVTKIINNMDKFDFDFYKDFELHTYNQNYNKVINDDPNKNINNNSITSLISKNVNKLGKSAAIMMSEIVRSVTKMGYMVAMNEDAAKLHEFSAKLNHYPLYLYMAYKCIPLKSVANAATSAVGSVFTKIADLWNSGKQVDNKVDKNSIQNMNYNDLLKLKKISAPHIPESHTNFKSISNMVDVMAKVKFENQQYVRQI